MRLALAFETVVSDRLYIQAGTTITPDRTFELFRPTDQGIEDNVIQMPEDQFLRFVLSNYKAAELLFTKLGHSPMARHALNVVEPIRRSSYDPDFDLIIWDDERPDLATAIQAKRIKVTTYRDGSNKVTKLRGLGQVVTQSRIQRQKYGFHKNYLAILIAVFDRDRKKHNILFDGISEETFKDIYDFPQRESIHDDVGVIFIKVVQPTGVSYRAKGSVGICLDKVAGRLDQTAELTKQISELGGYGCTNRHHNRPYTIS